jgi:hypothetical protein
MLVCTGMYHFEVSRTALYRVRYVLARTSTYHRVLPCTRCRGFQMKAPSVLSFHCSRPADPFEPDQNCGRNSCRSTIWILADVRCRTSDVRHRIIPMLHTMSYVVHVRHRTTSYRTMSYVEHVRHRISMSYVPNIRCRTCIRYCRSEVRHRMF